MRDVITELIDWWRSGESVGLATVVDTWRSAPRQPGASMLVGPGDVAVGSVSGGCVEGAVFDLARESRNDGNVRLQRYGVSDSDASAVGLTCGGTIDIFIEQVNQNTFPDLDHVIDDIDAALPVAVATVINDVDTARVGRRVIVRRDHVRGSLGNSRLNAAVASDAAGMLAQGSTGLLRYGPDGRRGGDDVTVFVATYAPAPRMIVFGAIDFAAAVARVGAFLNYRVTVCDARATFATVRRFPEADEVVVRWPHKYLAEEIFNGRVDDRTVICVLTHDPKFDVPLLELALRVPLAYIGAMGSRRTNEDRLTRLRRNGLTESELNRLHAPIGLDVGAHTPQETAVSIAAEIIAQRAGGSGSPLRNKLGPIHNEPASSLIGASS